MKLQALTYDYYPPTSVKEDGSSPPTSKKVWPETRTLSYTQGQARLDRSTFSLSSSSLSSLSSSSHQTLWLLLIHPVGIGMASWFWQPLIREMMMGGSSTNRPETTTQVPESVVEEMVVVVDWVAVNLPGCGLVQGASLAPTAWTGPESDHDDWVEASMSEWIQGCEALLQQVMVPHLLEQQQQQRGQKKKRSSWWSKLTSSWRKATQRDPNSGPVSGGCTVVVQGGMAPLGLILADRQPQAVRRLVLTSPPTWKEITKAVPRTELDRNFAWLTCPWLEGLAFGALESRAAIELFSNLFLFDITGLGPCSQEWIELAIRESIPIARRPIQAFNAGCWRAQSYQDLLLRLSQPLLILQGQADSRPSRQEYVENMPQATNRVVRQVETIAGKNVLPWESPREFWSVLWAFLLET